jgi:hypothetical protein
MAGDTGLPHAHNGNQFPHIEFIPVEHIDQTGTGHVGKGLAARENIHEYRVDAKNYISRYIDIEINRYLQTNPRSRKIRTAVKSWSDHRPRKFPSCPRHP